MYGLSISFCLVLKQWRGLDEETIGLVRESRFISAQGGMLSGVSPPSEHTMSDARSGSETSSIAETTLSSFTIAVKSSLF